MNIFNDNNITKRGYINKDDLLKYVSEKDIFKLVFGFKPEESDYVTSPFREDSRPGCRFTYSLSGRLKFEDFGSRIYIRGKRMINLDCFDAVQLYFKLPNLYETLKFIKDKLIKGEMVDVTPQKPIKKKEVKEVEILIETRDFNLLDRKFWYERYQISKQNLLEDKVFPISRHKVMNSQRYGDYISNARTISYCFTDFESGHKKIYRPYETKRSRFISTCTPNDIGNLRSLDYTRDNLVITKSYKDCRVLINNGLNSIWLQNEVTIPEMEVLLPICYQFKSVDIFFDNDETGIEQAKIITDTINTFLPGRVKYNHLPIHLKKEGITDPSDLIHKKGRKELLTFLHENKYSQQLGKPDEPF